MQKEQNEHRFRIFSSNVRFQTRKVAAHISKTVAFPTNHGFGVRGQHVWRCPAPTAAVGVEELPTQARGCPAGVGAHWEPAGLAAGFAGPERLRPLSID